jgi:MoaD family protein
LVRSLTITVKFIGPLRHVSGASERALDFQHQVSIRELMWEITKELPVLTESLIDQQLKDNRPNVLIIVNGKEIGVLNGLETNLQDEDEVVLVPVVHGG